MSDRRAFVAIALHFILTLALLLAEVGLKVALGTAADRRWISPGEALLISDILTKFMVYAVLVFCICTGLILLVCGLCSVRDTVRASGEKKEK